MNSKAVRVFNTVRYLKPVQVYGRLWRQRPTLSGLPLSRRRREGPWQPAIGRQNPQIAQNRFRFLNEEREIQTWNDKEVPKLWLYNLHYLSCPTSELIERWIAENPASQGNGWEPYPLSLRIVNWIKWELAGNKLSQRAVQSLANQARALAQSLEYRLQANHLLANFKALVFAGSFFSGSEAEIWLSIGSKGLDDQISEQVLEDGGHFERSPMYHALILEDLLDLTNLACVYPKAMGDWRGPLPRMLGWLEAMCHADGEISFFNDACLGVAPRLCALQQYARRLGIRSVPVELRDSGYIRLQNSQAVVLFDAAPIGPDYQPGHAHADTLSFELSVGGQRVLVNSGISTYENSAARLAQRGTAAHNTVRVDGQDQSEVWRAFRVARRAKPEGVHTDHRTFAQAAHTGYLRLRDPVLHRRRLELKRDALIVSDHLEGRKTHSVEIFFHCHPNAQMEVDLDPQLARSVEDTEWHPEFNRSVPNRTILGRWSGSLPVRFETRILLPRPRIGG
jgi:uncharacterized heparinase superfamily protein